MNYGQGVRINDITRCTFDFRWNMSRGVESNWVSIRFITTLALGFPARSSKAMVLVMSSAGPDAELARRAASFSLYRWGGMMCHAYRVSLSGVRRLKGWTWDSVVVNNDVQMNNTHGERVSYLGIQNTRHH